MTTSAASGFCVACQRWVGITTVVTVQQAEGAFGGLTLTPKRMVILACGHAIMSGPAYSETRYYNVLGEELTHART